MALSQEELDFINKMDTTDFIVRSSEYLLDYLNNNPNILIGKTLSGGYVMAYVNTEYLPELRKYLGASFISSETIVLGLLETSALEASGIAQVHSLPYLKLQGQGVLVGVVDTGIDYTLPVFIRDDGTSKIRYIYDQTVLGNVPEGFPIGTEYTNEQINEALRAEDPYTVVPQRDTVGHGTFIASVAAGRQEGEFSGAAPEAEIIAVKLKEARPYYRERFLVPPDQKNAFSSNAVILGVEYIMEKARELGRPVSICIGLGTNFGGHDGFTIFEEYLTGAASQKGVCLSVAAGNESQARHHMEGRIRKAGETQNIDIRVGENAGNINLAIWSNVPDRLSVAVRSPSGELVARLPAESEAETTVRLILESSTVTIRYFFPLEGSGGQLSNVQLLNATPGIWTVIVYGDIILNGTFHAWLPMTGFVSPTVEFLSASPYYTVTVPATMVGAICCGAYNSFNYSLYINTSWGPTRAPVLAPDLLAPGVEIGGFYPSGYGVLSGTSVASALTTGACALLLQWGIVEGNDPALSTYQIRAYLIRGCTRSTTMIYPNTQWGYGTLNLVQSFILMREL